MALRHAPGAEVVGGHGALEPRLLGGPREGEEFGGRKLLVRGVEADAGRNCHVSGCRCRGPTEPTTTRPVAATAGTFRRAVRSDFRIVSIWLGERRPASTSPRSKNPARTMHLVF